jgi:hypothetical protein
VLLKAPVRACVFLCPLAQLPLLRFQFSSISFPAASGRYLPRFLSINLDPFDPSLALIQELLLIEFVLALVHGELTLLSLNANTARLEIGRFQHLLEPNHKDPRHSLHDAFFNRCSYVIRFLQAALFAPVRGCRSRVDVTLSELSRMCASVPSSAVDWTLRLVAIYVALPIPGSFVVASPPASPGAADAAIMLVDEFLPVEAASEEANHLSDSFSFDDDSVIDEDQSWSLRAPGPTDEELDAIFGPPHSI